MYVIQWKLLDFSFKKCHAGKVIQDQVRNEINWAKQDNYLTVDAVSHLDKNYVQSFLEIVQNHAENDIVSIAGYKYYIDDLTYFLVNDGFQIILCIRYV